ncbi:MAG: protein translocase subunit SecD, partial [Nostocoides sp.]
MARKGRPDVEKRTFIGFLAIVLALLGLLVGANIWGTANATPKLGLDLEGGTQMVLTPRLVGEQSVTTEQIAQARDIIAERVDSQGVSGSEVTTQGEANIVVSMPGDPTRQQEDNLRRSSALQFRPVLLTGSGTPVPAPSAANPSATGTASGSA